MTVNLFTFRRLTDYRKPDVACPRHPRTPCVLIIKFHFNKFEVTVEKFYSLPTCTLHVIKTAGSFDKVTYINDQINCFHKTVTKCKIYGVSSIFIFNLLQILSTRYYWRASANMEVLGYTVTQGWIYTVPYGMPEL